MTSILKKQNLEVTAEGEMVAIQIGSQTLKLHYEDALLVSQWIRLRAKQAKNACGDRSRHWSAIAYLDGLEG
jgi:hypothetical protein